MDAKKRPSRGPGILVTGASGNVGRHVVEGLRVRGLSFRAPDRGDFDFTDPRTWNANLAGCRAVFLVRPPEMSNVERDLFPFLEHCRKTGVEQVVFLSLQGSDRNRFVPHAAVERWLRKSTLDWTFLRPSFFFQNLSTTHAVDIRERSRIFVPAGHGRTAFVDAADVGEAGALALADPEASRNQAWTLTSSSSLTYDEVAAVLSHELGRPVTYANPGVLAYAAHARRVLGMPWAMVGVTAAIYTTARLGLAGATTGELADLLGREPHGCVEFVRENLDAWSSP